MMVGNHITELHTQEHKEPAPTEFLNKVSNVLEVCDTVQMSIRPLGQIQEFEYVIKNKQCNTYK